MWGRVVETYEMATGAWQDANWSHYDDSFDCCGRCSACCNEGPHAGCSYCEQAARDAEEAERSAADAMAAAMEGQWDEAEDLASRASCLEKQYGDAPVWGPFFRAVRDARRAYTEIEPGSLFDAEGD